MNKKQTNIYLSDRDKEKLNKIKEILGCDTLGEVVRLLINEEYQRLQHYLNI